MPQEKLGPKVDMGFLLRDVTSQQRIASELLQQAQAAAKSIEKLPPGSPERAVLEGMREQLLRSARDLAANANTTSTMASSAIRSAIQSGENRS